MRTMKAAIFVEPGRIALEERPIPEIGPLDALVRIIAREPRVADLALTTNGVLLPRFAAAQVAAPPAKAWHPRPQRRGQSPHRCRNR